jgi:hypothetical protein
MAFQGDPDDPTLLCAKWESLALAYCGDYNFPDDFFLFTAVRRVKKTSCDVLAFFSWYHHLTFYRQTTISSVLRELHWVSLSTLD